MKVLVIGDHAAHAQAFEQWGAEVRECHLQSAQVPRGGLEVQKRDVQSARPAYEGLEEALGWNPNVVVVTTPAQTRPPIVRRCLDAGTVEAVLVEQPIALTGALQDQVCTASAVRKVPVVVSCPLRWVLAPLALLESRKWTHVTLTWFRRGGRSNGRALTHDLPEALDVVTFVLRRSIDEVYARATGGSPYSPEEWQELRVGGRGWDVVFGTMGVPQGLTLTCTSPDSLVQVSLPTDLEDQAPAPIVDLPDFGGLQGTMRALPTRRQALVEQAREVLRLAQGHEASPRLGRAHEGQAHSVFAVTESVRVNRVQSVVR